MTTKQSQYHYGLHLNKETARYQAIFIPSETVQEVKQEFFYFFWEAKQQGLETQTEETIVHSAVKGTHRSAVALKDGRLHGQRLGGRKDIKVFFPELTEEYREVGWPGVFYQKRCRKCESAMLPRRAALLWRLNCWQGTKHCGFSRLISISGWLFSASIAILKLLNLCLVFFFIHTHA